MTSRASRCSTLVLILLALLSPASASAQTLFVDDDAPPGGDGLSWATAYQRLETALAAGGATEIRVAGGVQKPTTGLSRTAFFRLESGLALRGGYRGLAGGGDPDDRDFEVFETILSGDLAGDDAPGFANRGENSHHVLQGFSTDDTAELDGFTISGGSGGDGNGNGAGLQLFSAGVTVKNCLFTDNVSQDFGGFFQGSGGAVYINSPEADVSFTDCRFISNRAEGRQGGAVYARPRGNASFVRCDFIDNHCLEAFSSGGGLHLTSAVQSEDTHWTVTECRFIGNSTTDNGGGANFNGSGLTMTNCLFAGNSAPDEGAGLWLFATLTSGAPIDDVIVTNCTIANNVGDGITTSRNPEITNSIVWGNTGQGVVPRDAFSSPIISFSDIQGSGGSGGGWTIGTDGGGNIDADPMFVDDDGADGIIGTEDDDLRIVPGSPCEDAGDETAPGLSGVNRDLSGWSRINMVTVDMGAYEAAIPIPTMPQWMLGLLAVLLAWFGVRTLRS